MNNSPFGTIQLLDILDKVPPDRLAAFKKELGIYVAVGSYVDDKLLIDWSTVRRQTDERAVVLKVLDFLTKELALQLVVRREEDGRPRFEKPAADTVLHEAGIRHDPALCRHCEGDASSPCPGSGLEVQPTASSWCPWCMRRQVGTKDGRLVSHPR